jgi:hypothetical protein
VALQRLEFLLDLILMEEFPDRQRQNTLLNQSSRLVSLEPSP